MVSMFEGQIVVVYCIYVLVQTASAPCTPLPDLAVGVLKIIPCDASHRCRLHHNALELLLGVNMLNALLHIEVRIL